MRFYGLFNPSVCRPNPRTHGLEGWQEPQEDGGAWLGRFLFEQTVMALVLDGPLKMLSIAVSTARWGTRMNGIHDMGGMTCFGPVERESDEPVFHADWERRVFALNVASLVFMGPLDRARHAMERMDPLEYLATGYYEHWLAGVQTVARDLGFLNDEELRSGRSHSAPRLPHLAPDAGAIKGLVRVGVPAARDHSTRAPVFVVGQRVRARNLEIRGHTRLTRYVRGKTGLITRLHGIHVLPDTAAHDSGENAQPLYNVRFDARELWGENVERRDCVHIDLWEDYLERT